MMKAKKALTEASGDFDKAKDVLRKIGAEIASEKSSRTASEGIIACYVHSNQKIAVLVELNCETDFVARNESFQELGKNIAMQIAAMNPTCVHPDDVDESVLEKEEEIYREQLKKEKKPADIIDKIIKGKLEKFKQETSLMSQAFIKDDKKKIEDLVTDAVSRLKENIQIGKFVRYQI